MDYLPSREADKRSWYVNLSKEVATNATSLGLTTADVAAIQAICAANIAVIDKYEAAQTAAKSARAAKATQLSKGDKDLRVEIKKLKSGKGYTIAIGTALNVIGEDGEIIDFETYKPIISAIVLPGRVRIEFIKADLDGVNIYSRIKGESVWTKLALDSYSPYDDTRPLAKADQPEHREYMAIGVYRDDEVTLQSDIIEAVFGG